MPSAQAKIWLFTIPAADWNPPAALPPCLVYLRGQREIGESGFDHWQLVGHFARSVRLSAAKDAFCLSAHAEPTRSARAEAYVWKEDTAVAGTRFELGTRPVRRNVPKDWDAIWDAATRGDVMAIPSDVRLRCWTTIKKISESFIQPLAIVRTCHVFWGKTRTGKSRRAWEEAGISAYSKDPRTKFWCGYSGQEHVVIDEFRGTIDIANMLRWLDRYPVRVELKGSSTSLGMTTCWITSNLHPREWYPDLDDETKDALLRRLTITQFH